ncbi:protein sprint isoform X2 [Vespula squamosa]|uniref:Protein sprint isoform X2 n=1 Tax=Vespula squamosa TaxID=30214 RepID=A0ABD2AFG2_VESSQ
MNLYFALHCRMASPSFVLRISVPDKLHNSLNITTVPVWLNMNTRDNCSIFAHKIRCTNSQDCVYLNKTLIDHEYPHLRLFGMFAETIIAVFFTLLRL